MGGVPPFLVLFLKEDFCQTEGFLKFKTIVILITVLGYFVMPGRLFNSSNINLILFDKLQLFLNREEEPTSGRFIKKQKGLNTVFY